MTPVGPKDENDADGGEQHGRRPDDTPHIDGQGVCSREKLNHHESENQNCQFVPVREARQTTKARTSHATASALSGTRFL